MFEIFPWNPQLETGIALVDEQHRVLVSLLNRLAQQHVQGATESEVQTILGELADYAHYHFETEEGIWGASLAGDDWLAQHIQTHQRFFDHIVALQSGNKPFQVVLDDLFSYLTQWLAYHILESDKRMALAVKSLADGLSLDAAHQSADDQMRGATATLIQALLAMYQTVSAQALELMHEKLARLRAEQVLLRDQKRWLFLNEEARGERSVNASPLENTLRTIIDNVPAGLVAADIITSRFTFANPWFCRMLGYSLDELLDMGPMDIHPVEAWPSVQADFEHMMDGERKETLAVPVRRKDGSIFLANVERISIELGGQVNVLAVFADVTEQVVAENALRNSEAHLHTLVDTIPDLIWRKDVNGVYLSCNPAFERLFGATEVAIVGKTDNDFVASDLAESFLAHDRAAMATLRPMINEEWVTYADTGTRALLETTKVPMRDASGKLVGVLGIGHDITQQRQATEALQAERARLQNAIDAAQAGTWEWDTATEVLRVNDRAAEMLGYPLGALREVPYAEYNAWIHADDQLIHKQLMMRHLSGELPNFAMELRMRHQDGHWVWCRTQGRVMQRDAQGQPLLVSGISIDISEQKTHRELIDHITHNDALTGLPNRQRFVGVLAQTMATHTPDRHLAVAYIDLDNFSAINLIHGMEVGHQLIVAVSQRLAGEMGQNQYLAHIGGDDFAVIMSQLQQPEDSVTRVEALLKVIADPLPLNGLTLSVTASIGVALLAPGDKVDAEQLLRQADQAMYRAKQSGKNRRYQFDPVTDEITRERLARLDEIRQGLLHDEFVLHYQPKVRLSTGEVIGFEALIRWQHPQRGLLSPYAFIGLVEQHPMAITLGDWVIDTALAQLAQWQAQDLKTSVSVNIDAMQLLDADFADRLQLQLRRQPTVSASQLELEILETGALGNMAQVSALIAQLQELGLSCALDDFGTGYSSLTFLKQLGARTLKIDQSFVFGMLDDAEDATIVNSVLGLARNFDRLAVAEGVETEAHGCLLIEFGCEFGQGYAIARPMPATQVLPWLTQWQLPASWASSRKVGPAGIPMLLAEVEHRAWLKHIQAYVTLPSKTLLPTNSQHCRFGLWLRRGSTVDRLQHQPGFSQLQELHNAIHQRANALTHQIAQGQMALARQDLGAVELLSQHLLSELRSLRQNQTDANATSSVFGEL